MSAETGENPFQITPREITIVPGLPIQGVFTSGQIRDGLAFVPKLPVTQEEAYPVVAPGRPVIIAETFGYTPDGHKIQIQLRWHTVEDLGPYKRATPYGRRTRTTIVYDEEGRGHLERDATFLLKILLDNEMARTEYMQFDADQDQTEDEQTALEPADLVQMIYRLTLPHVSQPIEGYLSAEDTGDTIIEDFPEDELGGTLTQELLLPGEKDILAHIDVTFSLHDQENLLN